MKKQDEMFRMVSKWKESGITKELFAKQQGVTIHMFNYWLQKHNKQNFKVVKEPEFIELKTNPVSIPVTQERNYHPQLEFILSSGLHIKIY